MRFAPSLFVFAVAAVFAFSCQGLLQAQSLAPVASPKPKRSPAAVLIPYVDRHELAGAVTIVADREKILDTATVGFADIGKTVPMKSDALFWIASMSKPMTATAVMMLVDEGKISLDDAVEKYLPEFKGQQVAVMKDGKQAGTEKAVHPITIRNVLSHTSGMDFKAPEEQPTLDGLPLEKAVKANAAQPLLFQPDSAYKYSNAGINTAARILEVVSGMKYEDFMRERLFMPLGMKDTTFWPDEAQAARLAKAYKPNAAKDNLEETTVTQLTYPLTDRTKRFPMPAGGLFSTAQDVTRFCQMMLNGGELDGKRYVSAEAVKQLTSRQTPAALKNSYGLGYAVSATDFGHGGAYATNMSIYPKEGLITVFMVQHAGFPGNGKESGGAFRAAALKGFGAR